MLYLWVCTHMYICKNDISNHKFYEHATRFVKHLFLAEMNNAMNLKKPQF